uniref:ethanolamine kinase n=1 Tax=Ciona savignyi TaxID=51511 RepID=H2ZLV2_CIOSA
MNVMKAVYNIHPATTDGCCSYENDNSPLRRLGSEEVTQAYQLCKEYLGGPWSEISIHEFEVNTLGGGLTNKLYICNLPPKYRSNDNDSVYPNTVLLRIYGLILQDFKAQIQESVVFSILAERKVGPKLFAVFPGGRLEEYLPSRTLCTTDLFEPSTSRHIARRIVEYHSLNMPVKKDPSFIISKLLTYLENTKSAFFEDQHKQSMFLKLCACDIDSEVKFVNRLISKQDVVVFCHNDIQEGNLLYSDRECQGNPVQMIDFEYSSYNYRGFDLANHFCEWMYDYSHTSWPFFTYKIEHFANSKQQENLIDAYLETSYKYLPARRGDPKWQKPYLLDEIKRFTLLSHLFWTLWSVVQAQISDIGFGYLEYALARMDAYFKHKKLVTDRE